jgi:spermidine synthase
MSTRSEALEQPTDAEASRAIRRPVDRWLPVAFMCSGFAALLYQVVWQRALYSIIGINIESVTVVVTAFLLGLGLGSLAGGALSRMPGRSLLRWFIAAECGIALFGGFSLTLFRWAGNFALHMSAPEMAVLVFAMVLLPTLMMGSTLPLLVTHLVAASGNVGRSVGRLYFVNTAGSAIASITSVMGLMGAYGEHGTVIVAAGFNVTAAASVAVLIIRDNR